MAVTYGIPYVGSKNRLAEVLISKIPSAENFYDLFCGGCAMSHAALLSGKFQNVYANDIRDTADFFLQCLSGEIKEEGEYYDRDAFQMQKENSVYCASLFSFGNDFKYYLYSKEVEEMLDCVNKMILSKTLQERKKYYNEFYELMKYEENLNIFSKRAGRLEVVTRLLRLKSISIKNTMPELIERFHPLQGDYREIELKKDSVIYCDIPYIDSTNDTYKCEFNYEEFYNYVRSLVADDYKVFISEYTAPSDFTPILEIETVTTMSRVSKSIRRVERLFVHKSQGGGEPPHQLMLPFDE